MLERIRRGYNSVLGGETIPPAASDDIRALDALAVSLREHRPETMRGAQLYREIHGALMHKIERVADAPGEEARAREDAVCARLRERLPLTGATLADLGDQLADSPDWLADPHGDFGTGLESLVYETVAATTEAFEAELSNLHAVGPGWRMAEPLVTLKTSGQFDFATRSLSMGDTQLVGSSVSLAARNTTLTFNAEGSLPQVRGEATFRAALERIDARDGDVDAEGEEVRNLLAASRPQDAISLLVLLRDYPRLAEGPMFDRLAHLLPTPIATRDAWRADRMAVLNAWWDALPYPRVKRWWTQWPDALPSRGGKMAYWLRMQGGG